MPYVEIEIEKRMDGWDQNACNPPATKKSPVARNGRAPRTGASKKNFPSGLIALSETSALPVVSKKREIAREKDGSRSLRGMELNRQRQAKPLIVLDLIQTP
jgi:hypothetical protein